MNNFLFKSLKKLDKKNIQFIILIVKLTKKIERNFLKFEFKKQVI